MSAETDSGFCAALAAQQGRDAGRAVVCGQAVRVCGQVVDVEPIVDAPSVVVRSSVSLLSEIRHGRGDLDSIRIMIDNGVDCSFANDDLRTVHGPI